MTSPMPIQSTPFDRARPSWPVSRALAAALGLAAFFPSFAAPATAQTAAEETEKTKSNGPAALPERPPIRTSGKLPLEWVNEIEWRSIGPANMGGRITDIAVNPNDLSEAWIATATGGVVHTVNGGMTYGHQFSDQRVASIGAIAVSPADTKRVWVGTGEPNPRNSVSWGDGVYVSDDSGATWRHAGLAESFQISTVVPHPTDRDVAYVGALGRLWGPNDQRGLYRTTDGGRTWERILFVDEDTGVVEVKMHPSDPATMIVATYERRRDMFDTNDPAVKWGAGSGLWRTTDGGETFERLTQGLPTGKLGRIGVSWSASQPDNVFAVVETDRITQEPDNAAWFGISFEGAEFGARVTDVVKDSPGAKAGLKKDDVVLRIADTAVQNQGRLRRVLRDYFAGDTARVEILRGGEVETLEITFDKRPAEENENLDEHGRRRDGPFGIGLGGQRANVQDEQGPEGFEYGGIFRSTDRGTTWTRINSLNPRPMYYSEIRVDPSDEDYVYVLGTRLNRSKDGGKTFTTDGHDGSVHVDHHALWIDPTDGRHMILGNDGGIYVTRDRMETWEHHNKLALGQFYNVSVGPRDDYNVYGGLQDNGSWGGPSRTSDAGPSNRDWFRVGGGDGFRTLADPENPDLIYYESQNGGMGRRDFRTGQGGFLRPRPERGSDQSFRFNWNTPFILSSVNSSIYYSAGNHVFRSLARGEGQEPISPEITATDRGAAVALADSPRDGDVLYVGTDDGAFWMTKDGGAEWIDLMAINGKPAFEAEGASDGERLKDAITSTEARAQRVAAPEVELAAADDTVAGHWRCKATGAGIENDDDGVFHLHLDVSESGKVSGRLESEIGDGPITQVRYRASTGDLSFRFVGDSLTMEFTAKVDVAKGSVEGSISAAEGAFRFAWKGNRDGAVPAQQETQKQEGQKQATQQGSTTTAAEAESASKEAEAPAAAADEAKAKAKDAKPEKFVENTIDQFLPGRRYVSEIEPSRFDTSRVYVTFDGHRSDDDLPYVFASEDYGQTWKSLRSNLPDEAGSVRSILEDATNENVLYLGTEHGIYCSIDRGESWTRFNSNLPTVPVHDLAQHVGKGELVAGTHGRSIWICDISAIGQMTAATLEAPATLFAPTDVQLRARARERGSDGLHGFRGTNPPSGAIFTYLLKDRARTAALEVRDARGNVVATVDASADKGLHRVEWNLRTGEDTGGGRRRVRRASPGEYTVRLVVNGDPAGEVHAFQVMNDPSQTSTEWIAFEEAEEELQALFDEISGEGDGDKDGE